HFKVNNTLTDWACGKCDKLLEWVTVKLQYLDQTFETDIPACPFCQGVLISEELAVGKMTMVEMLLEDK
ncbi:MAG TPA: DNA-binding protein, partial [Thermodesulfobacteriota bacterium]|nr:DNA-binding protein [Thermodesulfobacteriota bacterium]